MATTLLWMTEQSSNNQKIIKKIVIKMEDATESVRLFNDSAGAGDDVFNSFLSGAVCQVFLFSVGGRKKEVFFSFGAFFFS